MCNICLRDVRKNGSGASTLGAPERPITSVSFVVRIPARMFTVDSQGGAVAWPHLTLGLYEDMITFKLLSPPDRSVLAFLAARPHLPL